MPIGKFPVIPAGAEHFKLGILSDFDGAHLKYISSCEEIGIAYTLIDILSPDWIDLLKESDCDGFLFHPPNDIQERKSILDEIAWVIQEVLKKPIYPSFNELFIYENKRNMAWWLRSNSIPHANTHIFARKSQAIDFLRQAEYPLVFKTNIGAAASGVRIIHSRAKALRIARRIFGFSHPALTFGDLRFSRKFKGIPLPLFGRIQKHYLIAQEFIPIRWEWRLIRIGESYFGHKKLLKNGYASGSGLSVFDVPPQELFHLIRDICEKGGFRSMNVDIFETVEGEFLVNELQTIFGSINPSQMYRDGKPGRFTFKDGRFEFEDGVFNTHGSHLLRVLDLLQLILDKRGE